MSTNPPPAAPIWKERFRRPARQARRPACGKSSQVHAFDSGHTGVGVAQTIQHQALMLAFAQRVAG